MAKKPVFTDDELDRAAVPDPGATRPVGGAAPQPSAAPATRAMGTTPPPPAGIDAQGHARPATRIHGYGSTAPAPAPAAAPRVPEVVGWVVVLRGPGRGAAVALSIGLNGLGRGPDNRVQIDFGDETISREAHAFIAYDPETRAFHVAHAGKANLVRRNDAPVLTSERLEPGDLIRIGDTTLKFVPLCGPDFDWADA